MTNHPSDTPLASKSSGARLRWLALGSLLLCGCVGVAVYASKIRGKDSKTTHSLQFDPPLIERTHNLSLEGNEARAEYRLRNISEGPMTINTISASCVCIGIEVDGRLWQGTAAREPFVLQAGESASCRLRIHARADFGVQHMTLLAIGEDSSGKQHTLMASLKLKVSTPLSPIPDHVALGVVEPGQTITRELALADTVTSCAKILGLTTSASLWVSATIKPDDRPLAYQALTVNRRYTLFVECHIPKNVRYLNEKITLRLENGTDIVIPIDGTVLASYDLAPTSMNWNCAEGSPCQRQIVYSYRNEEDQDIRVSRKPAGIEIEITPLGSGRKLVKVNCSSTRKRSDAEEIVFALGKDRSERRYPLFPAKNQD